MRNTYTSLNGGGRSNYADVNTLPPNPFGDLASGYMPLSKAAMLRHSEYFALTQEALREAYRRISAYFVTRIKLTGDGSTDEIDAHLDYLHRQMGMLPKLVEAGITVLAYGNGFFSVQRPLTRSLVCPRKGCHTLYAFREFADPVNQQIFQFKWNNKFEGRCPRCGYSGDFGKPRDDHDKSRPLIFRSWSPHEIDVQQYNYWEGRATSYDWRIPSDFVSAVNRGEPHLLETVPWSVLTAITNRNDFRFEQDFIHHWRDDMLAGVETHGLGIPRAITNYRVLYQLQTLNRANEAIAVGHTLPLRVVSPKQNVPDVEGNPLRNIPQTTMRAKLFQAIAAHKQDPDTWHYFPVPVEYQALGADARNLLPKEQIEQLFDRLLNGVGMPVDFYKGSLQTTTAPVGLRLLERHWAPFVHGLNNLLDFVVRKVVSYEKWGEVTGELESVNIVDSIEKNQAKMQGAGVGMISRTEGLRTLDVDFEKDTRRKYEEQLTEALIADEYNRKMEALGISSQLASAGSPVNQLMAQQQAQSQGQPGGAAPGQDPNAQGGGTPPNGIDPSMNPQDPNVSEPPVPSPGQQLDPQSYMGMAQAYAAWLVTMPESQRTGKLVNLKRTNDLFHAAVRMQLENQRNQAEAQGRAQMGAQG